MTSKCLNDNVATPQNETQVCVSHRKLQTAHRRRSRTRRAAPTPVRSLGAAKDTETMARLFVRLNPLGSVRVKRAIEREVNRRALRSSAL